MIMAHNNSYERTLEGNFDSQKSMGGYFGRIAAEDEAYFRNSLEKSPGSFNNRAGDTSRNERKDIKQESSKFNIKEEDA